MKKLFISLSVLLLSVSCLCACSKVNQDTDAGTYTATVMVYNSVEYAPVELTGGDAKLVLKEDGSGTVSIGKGQSTLLWEKGEDGQIKITCDNIESNATRYNDVIVMDNGFGTTMRYVFVRKGADIVVSGKVKVDSGKLGDYEVEYLGAERYTDSEGSDAIKVFYNFTNNSETDMMSTGIIRFQAFQGEELLDYSKMEDTDPAYGDYIRRVLYARPGTTVRCERHWKLNNDKKVFIEAFTYNNDKYHCYTEELNLSKLTGAPEQGWLPAKVEDPKWSDGLEDAGKVGDFDVTIDKVEYADNEITMSITMTNNTDQPLVPSTYVIPRVYQDGLELRVTANTYPDEIAKDQTISVTYTTECRTDSPIEYQVMDYNYQAVLGGVLQVK